MKMEGTEEATEAHKRSSGEVRAPQTVATSSAPMIEHSYCLPLPDINPFQVVEEVRVKSEIAEVAEGGDDEYHVTVKMEVEPYDDWEFEDGAAPGTGDAAGSDEEQGQLYNKTAVKVETEEYESDPELRMVMEEEALEFSRMQAGGAGGEDCAQAPAGSVAAGYEDILRHISRQAGGDSDYYKCELCVRFWNDKEQFAAHAAEHGDDGGAPLAYVRAAREVSLRRAPAAWRRFLLATRRRPLALACRTCADAFLTRALLDAHRLAAHDGAGRQRRGARGLAGLRECDACGCAFLTEAERARHATELACRLCLRRFDDCKGVAEHALGAECTPRRSRAYEVCRRAAGTTQERGSTVENVDRQCGSCSMSYKGAYTDHVCPERTMKLAHTSCGASFETDALEALSNRTEEEESAAPAERAPHTCDFCAVGFATRGALRAHLAVAATGVSKCRRCGEVLLRECARRTHACADRGPPWRFASRVYDATSASSRKVRRHEDDAHASGGRVLTLWYRCLYCELRFSTKLLLYKHEEDNKLRPGAATTCGECGVELERECHRPRHRCGEMHRCDICRKGFEKMDFLITHTLKHHKEGVNNVAAAHAPVGEYRPAAPEVDTELETKKEPQERLDCAAAADGREVDEFIANNEEISHGDGREGDGDEEPTYSCARCGHSARKLGAYLAHLRHHGYEPPRCPACRVLQRRATFAAHVLGHVAANYGCAAHLLRRGGRGERRARTYPCGVCRRAVPYRELLRHWEEHVMDAPAGRAQLQRRCHVITNDVVVQKFSVLTEETKALEGEEGGPAAGGRRGERRAEKKGGTLNAEQLAGVIRQLLHVKKAPCGYCNKEFSRLSDGKRHLIEHLVDNAYSSEGFNEEFTCDICSHKSTVLSKFKLHLREHANLPLYQCQMCDKSFSDSSNFSKHKKVHGMMYMQCDTCRRRFTSKHMLVQHMKYHEQAKPLKCADCPRVFYFASSLKKHARKHVAVGTRPANVFRCKHCRLPFDTMKLKWDHLWKVHGARNVPADCPLCPTGYRNYSQLRAHMRTAHLRQITRQELESNSWRDGLETAEAAPVMTEVKIKVESLAS